MNYKQLVPFSVSNGGNVHYFCLANTCKGYGIPNKYGSAWEAWQHTEQHPDRNMPDGVDVPLYYSYTATIDGVTQNYGHINVRLKDGTVWSDGNIYPNLDAYLAFHTPKFVGWGESVNDIKVIEGEDVKPTSTQVGEEFQALAGRQPTQDEVNLFIGLNWFDGLKQYLFPSVQTLRDTVTNLENDRDTNLYPTIEKQKAEIEALKAQSPTPVAPPSTVITPDVPTPTITPVVEAPTPVDPTPVQSNVIDVLVKLVRTILRIKG